MPMTLLKIYSGAAPVLRRRARPIRRITAATRNTPPVLEELTVR